MEWIYAVALINGFVGRKHGEWITTREQADNAISMKFFPVTWTNTEVVCEFDLNQLRERSS